MASRKYISWADHAIIMWVAWTALGAVMIGTSRWFSTYWRYSIFVHAFLGWVVTGLTLYAGIAAIQKSKGFLDIKRSHSFIGSLMVIAVGVIALSGAVAMGTRQKKQWNTNLVTLLRKTHKSIALVVLTIGPTFQMGSGFGAWSGLGGAGKRFGWMGPANLVLVLVVFTGLEVWYRFKRDGPEVELKPKASLSGKTMTVQEFEQRVKSGEQLCILDDLVLEVGQYVRYHPGGSFLTEHTVGRDVSKFFYGGHALDQNSNRPEDQTPRHSHTNIARIIACDLAIAVLAKPQSEHRAANSIGHIDHNKTSKQNEGTATFTFKMTKAAAADQVKIKPYYDDLETLGKHYLVGATIDAAPEDNVEYMFLSSKVKRHYTISNCMEKTFYTALCNSCKDFLDDKVPTFDSTLVTDVPESDELCLTIKNYNVHRGASRQFSAPELKSQAYEIKGPMGKGLGLTAESQGVHMAFGAGTGVLVFVDVVARLILSTLELIPESQRFHPGFVLHMYASFVAREEAVALDLLEYLEKIQQKKGLSQFKLILRLSKGQQEKPPRWNEQYLDSQLAENSKQGTIARIWACGPPLMDEQFDQQLNRLSTKHSLDFKTQVEIL